MVAARVDAPTSATERGARSPRTLSAAACRARASAAVRDSSVSAVGNDRRMTPASVAPVTRKAVCRKTSSIWLFPPEDIGAKLGDPALARDAQQVLEQQRPDAPPLVLVDHGERDLGGRAGVVLRGVAADADDPLRAASAQGGDQRHVAHEVWTGEVIELGLAQAVASRP